MKLQIIALLIFILPILSYSQQIYPYAGYTNLGKQSILGYAIDSSGNRVEGNFVLSQNREISIDSALKLIDKRTLKTGPNGKSLSEPYDYMTSLGYKKIIVAFNGSFKEGYGPGGDYYTPILAYPDSGKWSLLNDKGKNIADTDFDLVKYLGHSAELILCGLIDENKDTLYGVYSDEGKKLLDVKFNKVLPNRYNNRNSFKYYDGKRWGIVFTKTNTVVPPTYDEVSVEPHVNLFKFREGKKYGFIDYEGKEFKERYDEVKSFDSFRLAYVRIGYKWYVIKDDGTKVYND